MHLTIPGQLRALAPEAAVSRGIRIGDRDEWLALGGLRVAGAPDHPSNHLAYLATRAGWGADSGLVADVGVGADLRWTAARLHVTRSRRAPSSRRILPRMTDWKLPWNAGCRCGQVRMRVTAPPLLTMACHCTGCQRMTASAYSLSVAVPADGFAIVEGEPVIGGLHGASRHYHCPHCKSWLFTRPDGLEGFVNLRATMLDDHAWFVPFVETCTAEGFAWAKTGAAHSFANIPPAEVFGPLVAEYAATGARP